MLRITQCAAPLAALLLVSAGFSFVGTTAEALPATQTPVVTSDPSLNNPGQEIVAEQEKAEAAGSIPTPAAGCTPQYRPMPRYRPAPGARC
jgi:hypothetical protein